MCMRLAISHLWMVTRHIPKGIHSWLRLPFSRRLVARNLNAQADVRAGKRKAHEPEAFRYKDKGAMATIGRNRAVVDMKHARLSGFSAWLAWMFVHLISLLGMRN